MINGAIASGRPCWHRAWAIRLALLLPAVAYLGVTIYRRDNCITGDEPRYVLLAESIVRDGDVELKNNYASHGTSIADALIVKSSRGWYSVHNVGFPLMIAPAWFAGGTLGAKLFLTFLAGLAPLVVNRIVTRRVHSPGWSLLVTLAITLGMPLANSADQIYPDLPSGLMVLYAADFVIGRNVAVAATRARFIAFIAVVAFLPWLHVKQAAPAMVLLAGYFGFCRREHAIRRFASAVALTFSLSALACYNLHAFDNPFGPYAQDEGLCIDVSNNVMVLCGMYWDQAQGMFLQQPFLLLGLAGMAPMWRHARRSVLWLALLAASLLLPNCLHPNLYGGGSYAGRFVWSSLLLWCFPLAYSAQWLSAQRPRTLLAVCAASLALQAWLASHWLGDVGRMYQAPLDAPLWAYNGMYPMWRDVLPFWHDGESFWRHGPNYTFLLFGAGLAACGWLARRVRRTVWATIALVSLCVHPLRAPIADWTPRNGLRGSSKPGQSSGIFTDLRWMVLKSGAYRVHVEYTVQGRRSGPVGCLVVGFGAGFGTEVTQITEVVPTGAHGGEMWENIHVNRRRGSKSAFIGVTYLGQGSIEVKRVSIEPLRR